MKKIVVFTGAGISAESGLGTFRDSGGLWEQYKIEDVATPEAFAKNPALVLIRISVFLFSSIRILATHLDPLPQADTSSPLELKNRIKKFDAAS